MNTPLKNAKHEHFAQLVSATETPARAYVLDGFSEKGARASANRLLRNADVCSRVEHLRSIKEQQHAQTVTAVVQRAGLSKEWVIEQLMENVSMAKAAEPVVDSEGNPTGEYKQNINAANRALELLGKEVGMFIDRKEIRTGPLDGLPPEEANSLLETINAIQRARTGAADGRATGIAAEDGGADRR
mgnify:FL=1